MKSTSALAKQTCKALKDLTDDEVTIDISFGSTYGDRNPVIIAKFVSEGQHAFAAVGRSETSVTDAIRNLCANVKAAIGATEIILRAKNT